MAKFFNATLTLVVLGWPLAAQAAEKPIQWNGLIGEAAVEKLPKAVHVKKPGDFAIGIIKDAKEFEAFWGAGAVNTKIDVDWDKHFLAVVILKENTNRLKFKDLSAKDKGLVLTFEWELIQPAYKGRNPAMMVSFDKKDVAFVRFIADGHKDELGEIKLAGDKEPAKPSLDDDRETLCGDGKSAWKFEKKDAEKGMVRLYFAKSEKGKPDNGLMMYGDGGFIIALGFEYSLEEKDGKRQIKIVPGTAFSDKESDPVLPYKLDGDKLQLLGGKDGKLELRGEWKRVPLK